ncbi:hypothetical protein [Hymenobacter fodinae]|uniref:Uncharacterized protein n=1 Tax=Hymenobacter fodinae TaxID=2510796 RepID=A0A4Z0P4V0_9BACT|nr:hypothetical protein [Hymenobacter fodinae]TGE06592.1 hypothetical protein EU556_17320 [Hymenobacter fodinae]
MPEYLVKANGTREFHLLAADTQVGVLHYPEWYTLKADVQLANGSAYQVEPRGFWGTTLELKDQQTVLLSFKMNWSGDIIIKSKLDASAKVLVFKSKSVLKHTYVLHDKEGRELLTIQPDFQWSKLNYNYTITTTPDFEQVESQALLLLMAVHCANYFMTMLATVTTFMVAT